VGSASSPHLIKLLCPQDPIVSDECTNGNLILCVANVAAYADYYRCLPMIANLLRANLLNRASDINLLKDAAYEPVFHLGLAVALRFVALFEEVLKHYARRSLYYLQDALNNNPYHQDDSYYSQSLFVRNDIVKGQSVPLHEDVLPAQVVPLAHKKNREMLCLIDKFDTTLRWPVGANIPKDRHVFRPLQWSFLSGNRRSRYQNKTSFLTGSCINDFINHLCISYVPHKNIYFPSDHTLQSSTCLEGGWFYRQLEVDIRYALETNNNPFMGGEYSPRKTLGKLYNVNKRKIKTAMQPILKKMHRQLSHMITGNTVRGTQLGPLPKPARWEFPFKQYYFTNIEVHATEHPWKEDHPDVPAMPDINQESASESWLRNVGLIDAADAQHKANQRKG
jgi:hypothetical protein